MTRRRVIKWLKGSAYLRPLSPACRMCARGSKLVILVTGLCPAKCFYCPLSNEKKGKDVIYANERRILPQDIDALIEEAKSMRARGAGITGGDPLMVPGRVEAYIRALKERFGKGFNIHLYTTALKNGDSIPRLAEAGLDEIRFHPMPQHWSRMDASPLSPYIHLAIDSGIDVALEVPVLPDSIEDLKTLLIWADSMGLSWVNLNELEYSETNYRALVDHGYRERDDYSPRVQGSDSAAWALIEFSRELGVGVHYCTVGFKDGIQLRNRILRRARTTARPYDVITEEGTLLRGLIYGTNLEAIYHTLRYEFSVPRRLMKREEGRLIVAPWVLQETAEYIGERYGARCYLTEFYPTSDAIEVERIPLPM